MVERSSRAADRLDERAQAREERAERRDARIEAALDENIEVMRALHASLTGGNGSDSD